MEQQHKVKFLWNGIRVDGTFYKGHYSTCPYTKESSLPEDTITIYMERSNTPRFAGAVVENDSDPMTDYFTTDTVRVFPGSELHEAASHAALAYQIHMLKGQAAHYERRLAKPMPAATREFYERELARARADLNALMKQRDKTRAERKHSAPQR